MRELIDTHCHIDVSAFAADRAEVLRRARGAGVSAIVVPAIHAEGWAGLLEVCGQGAGQWPRLYPALGLHPVYLAQHRDADLAALEAAVATGRPVAIGEIGLDHFVSGLSAERQLRLFEAQLGIARDAGLPVLLHVRKAHDLVLAALARTPVVGGIAHAFNGSLQQAERYLGLGFKLGLGGMLTYARSSRLRRLAAELPPEAIVLETDAPDMTVAAHHGERNSPEYLPDVLAALADIRRTHPDRLAERTASNAREVLRLT